MNPQQFTGTIVRGTSNGRRLGFPTANIECADAMETLPKPTAGVYKGTALFRGVTYPAVMCFGMQPHYNKTATEVHMIGAPDLDYYGEVLTATATDYMRAMQKYNSEAELVAAIAEDVRAASE